MLCHLFKLKNLTWILGQATFLFVSIGLMTNDIAKNPMYIGVFILGFSIPLGLLVLGSLLISRLDRNMERWIVVARSANWLPFFSVVLVTLIIVFILEQTTGAFGDLLGLNEDDRRARIDAGLTSSFFQGLRIVPIKGGKGVKEIALEGPVLSVVFKDGSTSEKIIYRDDLDGWFKIDSKSSLGSNVTNYAEADGASSITLPESIKKDFVIHRTLIGEGDAFMIAEPKAKPGERSLFYFEGNSAAGFALRSTNVGINFRTGQNTYNGLDMAFQSPVPGDCFQVEASAEVVVMADCNWIYSFKYHRP